MSHSLIVTHLNLKKEMRQKEMPMLTVLPAKISFELMLLFYICHVYYHHSNHL